MTGTPRNGRGIGRRNEGFRRVSAAGTGAVLCGRCVAGRCVGVVSTLSWHCVVFPFVAPPSSVRVRSRSTRTRVGNWLAGGLNATGRKPGRPCTARASRIRRGPRRPLLRSRQLVSADAAKNVRHLPAKAALISSFGATFEMMTNDSRRQRLTHSERAPDAGPGVAGSTDR